MSDLNLKLRVDSLTDALYGTSKLQITINHTINYMGRGVMIFRRGIEITRGIGWVVLGPGIARAYLGPLNGTRRQPSAIFGQCNECATGEE